MDRIIIKGLKLYAFHGVNPEEKENGQPFELDIAAYLDLSLPCRTDRVEDTVSYAKIIKTARAAFLSAKFDLLEKAAQVTADAILEAYPAIERVEILLKKPEAPIRADFGYVAVEIGRSRHA